jgi:hypothetical protein
MRQRHPNLDLCATRSNPVKISWMSWCLLVCFVHLCVTQTSSYDITHYAHATVNAWLLKTTAKNCGTSRESHIYEFPQLAENSRKTICSASEHILSSAYTHINKYVRFEVLTAVCTDFRLLRYDAVLISIWRVLLLPYSGQFKSSERELLWRWDTMSSEYPSTCARRHNREKGRRQKQVWLQYNNLLSYEHALLSKVPKLCLVTERALKQN